MMLNIRRYGKRKSASRPAANPRPNRSEFNKSADVRIQEWERWYLRSGISPDANHSMNRIGIYTDFT